MTLIRLLALLVALLPQRAIAENSYCHQCGGSSDVRKVCRVVCDMEPVKTVTYDYVCEDFCIPGKSITCGCQQMPTCGPVRTRRKLVKHEQVRMVPKYKCVVEYLCPDCCH